MSALHDRVFAETQGRSWINLGHYDISPGVESGGGSAIATVSAVAVGDPEHSHLLMKCVDPAEAAAIAVSRKVAREVVTASTKQALIVQEEIQAIADVAFAKWTAESEFAPSH